MYIEMLMQYAFSYTTEEFDELCFEFGRQDHGAELLPFR